MSWEFSTDSEFEEQLAWMRGFVAEHVCPLETLELDDDDLRAELAPLQADVKKRALWADTSTRSSAGRASAR